MANALNVKPTRMELSTLKARLKVAENGYDLLKDKQDELMRQFIDLIKENNRLRNEVEDELSGALKNFVLASSSMNDAFMEEIVALPTKQTNLEISRKNIMSVIVPEMSFSYDETAEGDDDKELKYGYLNTSSELDDAIEVLNDVMPKLLKLSEIEKTCQLMATEIESTRRRVNALEYRMIPNFKETIKYIQMKLDENERASITRMIKVKDMG
ncbi:V-type ATP synthase subunit D [Aerococcus sp. 1KP-2016]|jgi:V/A-type H+-transporting ATPase subunit D|uniref:V-type ATP synthase subunit D n=1 Tax=Aerococcus sp. 1KP-2016 TaxID=1981982 RepID=UPI000B98AFEB|nr:V-type ATP synthase subunit D [Aerococcus sp. 1KP-2016]OYQ65679.1 V-type ATP synthase subunit D [Aerococcus sp. 1KP-2016]